PSIRPLLYGYIKLCLIYGKCFFNVLMLVFMYRKYNDWSTVFNVCDNAVKFGSLSNKVGQLFLSKPIFIVRLYLVKIVRCTHCLQVASFPPWKKRVNVNYWGEIKVLTPIYYLIWFSFRR